jgi:glycosyltransferase involved in cell wall biosynthesis
MRERRVHARRRVQLLPVNSATVPVYINGRFLGRRPTGVDRFAAELMRGVDQLLGERLPTPSPRRWLLIAPPGSDLRAVSGLRNIEVVTAGRGTGAAWEQLCLPLLARDGLLLNLCNTAPMFKRKQLVVIHDAGAFRNPQSYSRPFRAWYSLLHPWLGRHALSIGTVSQFSRRELAACIGVAVDRIALLSEGAEHSVRSAADLRILARCGLDRRPFFLAVGSRAPHKNFALLSRVHALLERPQFDIVVVGGSDARVYAKASREAMSEGSVRHLGFISDAELRALYQSASGFLFPSCYEGFGLPPLEAMACGCPVIASSAASIPEVLGNAAMLVDPTDPNAWKQAMLELASNTGLAAAMRAAGREHAARYTWRAAAQRLFAWLSQLGFAA